jgi:hypothetical protein
MASTQLDFRSCTRATLPSPLPTRHIQEALCPGFAVVDVRKWQIDLVLETFVENSHLLRRTLGIIVTDDHLTIHHGCTVDSPVPQNLCWCHGCL